MMKSYDFVPFLECRVYKEKGTLEGRIPIIVKTLTPIHIFSGHFKVQDNGKIYREFIRINDRPVIPGTSFKGCVRTIAESIAYSCLQTSLKGEKLPENKWHRGEQKCIICDMFGSRGNDKYKESKERDRNRDNNNARGSKSKIRFSDLVAVTYKTEVKGIPASFKPHPESSYYIENGKYRGYKFYRHGINGVQATGPVLCEFVGEGAVFEGEVIFKSLTEEEVGLLCFALGLSGDIQLKIGYGKTYFYGSVEVSSQPEWAVNARQYFDRCDNEVRKRINALVKILSYGNALKSYEG
jgi:CRISPR/Cas system CSM-associated protein Csm3 (group 7 of RAMP superfamily)